MAGFRKVRGPIVAERAFGQYREDAMALIKRVVIAAAMSLLSEGCIAAEAPTERARDTQTVHSEQVAHAAQSDAASGSQSR